VDIFGQGESIFADVYYEQPFDRQLQRIKTFLYLYRQCAFVQIIARSGKIIIKKHLL